MAGANEQDNMWTCMYVRGTTWRIIHFARGRAGWPSRPSAFPDLLFFLIGRGRDARSAERLRAARRTREKEDHQWEEWC